MGFRKYRTKAATAAEKRPIRMVTYLSKWMQTTWESGDPVEKDQ
jgi:hypothetical protein